jgi:hypothetical protein
VAAAHYRKDALNCWTNCSDISGYHTDFHEGHGTVGALQGHSMACVNFTKRGMAGARHGQGMVFELAFIWNDTFQEAANLSFKKCPIPIYFQKYCH